MISKILVAFFALGILASNAFASRATTLVDGTGDGGTILNGGSFFYDDNYNIFYNPAYVNDFKNYGIIEKSNFPGNTAQGGFVTSMSNWNIGAYFNRGNAIVSTPGLTANTTPQSVLGANYGAWGTATPSRPIDIYLGTDLGMAKVGLGITYAGNTATASQNSVLVGHLGAEIMGLDPFVNADLSASDSNPAGGSHSYLNAGLRYHWGEWVPYFGVMYSSDSALSNPSAVSSTVYKELNVGGGIGRSTKVSDSIHMMYALSYWSVNDTTNNGFTPGRYMVPIDFAVEGDAASWLTLRAGVSFHLLDRSSAYTVADNTTGRVGATIHCGKVDVEWALGRSFNPASNSESSTSPVITGAPAVATGAPANAPYDAQGIDIGAQFFSALNVAYHW